MQTYTATGKKELQQDSQYMFPYHYLPTEKAGVFTQVAYLRWGYEYLSYVQYVQSLVHNLNPKSVLDIGCGDGRLVYELQKQYQGLLLGVDTSPRAIALAKAMNPDGKYECVDVSDFPSDDQFEMAILMETLEHIPPDVIPTFIQSIAERVTSGGRLIITVPSSNEPVGSKHYQHFSLQSLSAAIAPHFTIEESLFCNKKSWLVTLMQSVLINRFWIIEWKFLRKLLFASYKRYFFNAAPTTGKRICAVCTKVD